MTLTNKPWMKLFAFRWLIAFALHALALEALSGSGTVSAMFSPGGHLSSLTILIAGVFVVLRVYVMLLGPAALISLLAFLQQRRAQTPTP